MNITREETQKIISALEVQIASIHSMINEIYLRGDTHAEHYMKAAFDSIDFNKKLIKKLSKGE